MMENKLDFLKKSLEKRQIQYSSKISAELQQLTNGRILIKYGGSIMLEKDHQSMFFDDVKLLNQLNIPFVIVHGGGPIINEVMQKYNLEKRFIDGLRVTDETTMRVTEMALSGIINKDIVNQLLIRNISSVGISGKDANIIEAEKLEHPNHDLGFVGKINKINEELIELLLNNQFVPVISPVARNMDGITLNINADTAASEISSKIKSTKTIFLTDVDGILKDEKCIHFLNKLQTERLIHEGIISGGMIPKVKGMINCLEQGVKEVHVIHGLKKHSLLSVLFGQEEIGTTISNE